MNRPVFTKRLVALVFIIAILLMTCAVFAVGRASSRYIDANDVADTYVDCETGVVYYVFKSARGISNMMAVCPRYMPDGTLYTVNTR